MPQFTVTINISQLVPAASQAHLLPEEGKLSAVRNLQWRAMCNLLPQFNQLLLSTHNSFRGNTHPAGDRDKPEFNEIGI